MSLGASSLLNFDKLDFFERADGFVAIESSDALHQSEPFGNVGLSPLLFFIVSQICLDLRMLREDSKSVGSDDGRDGCTSATLPSVL